MRRQLAPPPGLSDISATTRRALAAALDAAIASDRPRALGELEEALANDSDVPAVRIVAGQIRHSQGQYQRALDELDQAARGGAALQADELRYGFTSRLGWNREAREVVERRIAAGGPEERAWRGRAVRLFGLHRHDPDALAHLDRLIATSPPSPALQLNAAHLRSRVGEHARARVHMLEAIRLEPDRAALRAGAALLLAEGGYGEEARAQTERLTGAAADAVRAQLCLWGADLEGAAMHSERCLARAPTDALGHRVRGAIALRRGDPTGALRALDASLAADSSDPETYVWRAEALLRLGEHDRATAEVDRGLGRSDRYLFAAQVIRLLATLLGERDETQRLSAPSFTEIREGCAEVDPSAREIFARGERSEVIPALERVLARLGGNRGDRPTWLAEGAPGPRPLLARTGARFDSRWALDLIRIAPLDEVLGRLDECAARHRDSSLPLAHRGEANMWMGHYDEARRDLERALEINLYTRWAYVGISALENIAGRSERALEVSALGVQRMGSTGPAVYVNRGEAYRRLGRFAEAIEDLETARRINPTRLGGTINLALAYGAAGHEDRAAALHREIVAEAPGLVSDAALAIGVDDWQELAPAAEKRARLLESALVLMRGNRSSSCHTYVTDGGVVRTAPRRSGAAGEGDPAGLRGAMHWFAEHASKPARPRSELRRDVELVALRAGLRRAIRLALTPADLVEATARYQAAGLIALAAPTPADYDGERHDILIVSMSEADATAAVAAEHTLDVRGLGRLLGYPECCVRHFAARVSRADQLGIAFDGAREAWVPRPHPRLNNILFGVGARFISFEPCRYDCPAAIAVADAIAAAVGAVSPETVTWIDEQLRRSVAIDAVNARALVELEGGGPGKVARAVPTPAVSGRPIDAPAQRLADRISGATVAADGTLACEGEPLAYVLDFAWASRMR